MEDCIFCKIINKQIPSKIVYEDDDFLAFLDIHPASIGHTIVVCKSHHQDILNCSDQLLSKILIVCKNIAFRLQSRLHASGFNILNNCGAIAGQTIFHLHFHIIPRFDDNDGFNPTFKSNYEPILSVEEVYNLVKN